MTSNRRTRDRVLTCVAVGFQVNNQQQLALIRDASTSGAMLFTRKPLTADEKLTINIQADDKTPVAQVVGHVVRVEKLKEGFWSYAVAVKFHPPREDLAPLFEDLAERQERLFGPAPKPKSAK